MEKWKAISIAPNYMVSDNGRVKRVVATKSGTYERILKPEKHTNNYRRVSLCLPDATVRRQYIHRLVAEHFIGPPPMGVFYACHKDGDPTNNAISNVYWGTPKQNVLDAQQHGTFRPLVPQKGEAHHHSRLTEDIVRRIRADNRTLNAIASDYGIHLSTVHGIKTGKSWRHVKD